jgi:hypothetical protein
VKPTTPLLWFDAAQRIAELASPTEAAAFKNQTGYPDNNALVPPAQLPVFPAGLKIREQFRFVLSLV